MPAGRPGLKGAILSPSVKKKWNNTRTIKQTHLWDVLKVMQILTCMGMAPGGICAPKLIPIIPCMLGCMTGTMGNPCCCCCCCCCMGTMPAQTRMKSENTHCRRWQVENWVISKTGNVSVYRHCLCLSWQLQPCRRTAAFTRIDLICLKWHANESKE